MAGSGAAFDAVKGTPEKEGDLVGGPAPRKSHQEKKEPGRLANRASDLSIARRQV